MNSFLGEFECKLDPKGRLMIPSGLKKQLPMAEQEGLVLNRGFEPHLVAYTRADWNLIMNDLSQLNQYEQKTREFVRYFTRGATELTLDATGRILLPKSLMEYAGIGTEVILSCQMNKIEIWDKARYESTLDNEPENFARLAEEVMGGKRRTED